MVVILRRVTAGYTCVFRVELNLSSALILISDGERLMVTLIRSFACGTERKAFIMVLSVIFELIKMQTQS